MSFESIEFSGVIPWQPHSKIRPRVSKGGRRTHQDPKDAAAEKRTSEHLEEVSQEWPILAQNIAVSLRFFRASAQVVDLDNLVKHWLDSANGVLFVDDQQVTRISAELHLDRELPRTEWMIRNHPESSMIRDLTNRLVVVE